MTPDTKLLATLEGGVKRVTFNRPERRNALDFEMFARLSEVFAESAADGTRVVILAGAGDSFCSGLDLTSIDPAGLASLDVEREVRELINPAILRMRELPVPVVARVHGAAAGIGFSYVLASDVCVASDQSQFSQSFVRVGLMPDGGSTYLLPRLVGYRRAFELMATGETVGAEEARRLGLVNRVVPFEELDATVDDLARRLVEAPRTALGRIKAALTLADDAGLRAALDFEAAGQHECFRSPDFLEGVAAFMQKRKPSFGKTSGPGRGAK